MVDKIVFLSDVHLTYDNPKGRLDKLPETQFKKLEFVYDWAYENGAIVCQCGDLVDKPRSWYLLPLLTRFFLKWKVIGVKTYMVRGQHDHYFYSEASGPATVVGTLLEAKFITLIDGGPTKINLDGTEINLYGASFGQKVPEPDGYSDSNILLTHREISDTQLFPGHSYFSHKGFLKRHKYYKLIACADIHRKFKAGVLSTSKKIPRYIVNTGPMLRSSATTYNFEHKPGFYVWNPKTQKLNWKLIPCEPADQVLSRAHINSQEENDRQMAELTLKLKKRMKFPTVNPEEDSIDTNNSPMKKYDQSVFEYIDEHSVSKEVSSYFSEALAEIDIDDI